MKEQIKVENRREVLSLLTDIGFAQVPDWYGASVRTLKMNLIVPKQRENHPPQPCLLFFCGGAFATVNGAVWMPEMMYFAERGFTVATAEYRTSNQAVFPAALMDAKAAVRFLKAHAGAFCIDPDNIFVSGESAGGTVCSLVGLTQGCGEYEAGDYLDYDSSVRGVIDFYGLTDIPAAQVLMQQLRVDRSIPIGAVNTWIIDAFLGERYAEETALKASAQAIIGERIPPFCILHGTMDTVVDIGAQSDAFYDKLVAHGADVEYYRVEGAGHGDDLFYQDEVKAKVLRFMRRVMDQRGSACPERHPG